MSKLLTYGIMQQKRKVNLYIDSTLILSFRKIISDYGGYCIKVRRSSDNSTQDIGFTSGTLDESALTTFCGSGNGFIDTWYDQSGNGLNAVQATTTAQPRIVSSGTVDKQNDIPSVYFGGSNYFTISDVSFQEHNFDFFIISNSTLNDKYFLVSSGGAPLFYITNGAGSSNRFGIYIDGLTGGWKSNTNVNITNAFSLLNVYWNSGTLGLNVDDDEQSYSRLEDYHWNTTFTLYLGRRNDIGSNFAGYISETILFNTNISANRNDINTDINSFYSIY